MKKWDAGTGILMRQEEDKVSTQAGKESSATVFVELLKAQCGQGERGSPHMLKVIMETIKPKHGSTLDKTDSVLNTNGLKRDDNLQV